MSVTHLPCCVYTDNWVEYRRGGVLCIKDCGSGGDCMFKSISYIIGVAQQHGVLLELPLKMNHIIIRILVGAAVTENNIWDYVDEYLKEELGRRGLLDDPADYISGKKPMEGRWGMLNHWQTDLMNMILDYRPDYANALVKLICVNLFRLLIGIPGQLTVGTSCVYPMEGDDTMLSMLEDVLHVKFVVLTQQGSFAPAFPLSKPAPGDLKVRLLLYNATGHWQALSICGKPFYSVAYPLDENYLLLLKPYMPHYVIMEGLLDIYLNMLPTDATMLHKALIYTRGANRRKLDETNIKITMHEYVIFYRNNPRSDKDVSLVKIRVTYNVTQALYYMDYGVFDSQRSIIRELHQRGNYGCLKLRILEILYQKGFAVTEKPLTEEDFNGMSDLRLRVYAEIQSPAFFTTYRDLSAIEIDIVSKTQDITKTFFISFSEVNPPHIVLQKDIDIEGITI